MIDEPVLAVANRARDDERADDLVRMLSTWIPN